MIGRSVPSLEQRYHRLEIRSRWLVWLAATLLVVAIGLGVYGLTARSAAPAQPAAEEGDILRNASLEALLPTSVGGQTLERWSLRSEYVAAGGWVADLGDEIGAEPVGYAVAYTGDPAKSYTEGRYTTANAYDRDSWVVRVHAVTFAPDVEPAALLAAFERSYGTGMEDPRCSSLTVDGRGVSWCYERGMEPTVNPQRFVWGGEINNWYGYAEGRTLYLVEAAGDLERGGEELLGEILSALP